MSPELLGFMQNKAGLHCGLWTVGRDRDRDRQEPALLLLILTPHVPLKLPGKVKSCRELSILSLPLSP